MHVIQATKAYLPHLGGVETIVQQLAEGIAAVTGHTSTVVACSDDKTGREELINGVRAIYAPTIARVASLPISPAYARSLFREEADILHIHEPSLLPAAAYLSRPRAAKRRFRKLVVWWHSDIVRQRAVKPLYQPLMLRLLDAADAIMVATPHHIASSEYLRRFESKCRVVHFGVDPKRFEDTPELNETVSRMQAQYDKPIVLFSGRLVYYKGASYLVEAMKDVPDAHLVMVGKGPLLTELQALAAQGRGNVTFIPYLSEHDFIAAYKACSLFVLPSVANSEAFGIVQLEAMACGKPVITADLPTGVTYVNQHNETGLVVPLRDSAALSAAINKLIADDVLRLSLGEFARDRVMREFTIDQMLANTMGIYESLLC